MIIPVQAQQLSCLGTQSLDAGAPSEGVWACAWMLCAAFPDSGQAWGHGPEHMAIVPSVLPAQLLMKYMCFS